MTILKRIMLALAGFAIVSALGLVVKSYLFKGAPDVSESISESTPED